MHAKRCATIVKGSAGWTLAGLILLSGASACGPQLPPELPPLERLALGAELYLRMGRVSPGPERLSASALFAPGDSEPLSGELPRGKLRTLAPRDRLFVNGTPLLLSIADWGPSYRADEIPEAADGRYTFRLDIDGGTVLRTVSLKRVNITAPTEVVHASAPVRITWEPGFQSAQGVSVGLSSCVISEPIELTPSSANLSVRLSTLDRRCASVLHVGYVRSEPLGAPFAHGKIQLSTGNTRDVLVLP